jgi:hypothetical protein
MWPLPRRRFDPVAAARGRCAIAADAAWIAFCSRPYRKSSSRTIYREPVSSSRSAVVWRTWHRGTRGAKIHPPHVVAAVLAGTPHPSPPRQQPQVVALQPVEFARDE